MSQGAFNYEDEGYRARVEPHRGTMVLVFGILSIVVCGPFGIAAWIMGGNDLAAIKAGRMDRDGESTTQIGYILGIIGTILMAIQIVLFCIIIGMMGVVGSSAGSKGY